VSTNIDGIFYEETKLTLGTGSTQKTQMVKNYCKASQVDKSAVEVIYLNQEGSPTGIKIEMPIDEFLKKFVLDPNYKVKTKEERQVDKHIALAEKHRQRKEPYSAEWEYTSALKLDEDNVRANFGIGTLYMEMGEQKKAKEVFQKLAKIDAIFDKENKHIFNEFGISLRKTHMFDEALSHYLKAIDISPDDENLHFNVARVYYEKGEINKAFEWLDKALEINPDFNEAKKFGEFLKKESGKNKKESEEGKPTEE
ncbi:MAG: tetratricopeptide repeat protein, partial [Deltaproteobacteria bacterium]|nr:tetratricopeptide repeat protein [Deltaproteobacteria bacterium]